ncbi:MAG TPA: polyhydroxyalkanoic acid system family protein [Pirellulaceae bacterium]
MPKVTVSVPHDHPPDELVTAARPYIEKMVEDFEGDDLKMEWQGTKGEFSFRSLMFQIHGEVTVDDKAITVQVDLPFAAMLFKDKVEKAITKNLTRAIESGGASPESA